MWKNVENGPKKTGFDETFRFSFGKSDILKKSFASVRLFSFLDFDAKNVRYNTPPPLIRVFSTFQKVPKIFEFRILAQTLHRYHR